MIPLYEAPSRNTELYWMTVWKIDRHITNGKQNVKSEDHNISLWLYKHVHTNAQEHAERFFLST